LADIVLNARASCPSSSPEIKIAFAHGDRRRRQRFDRLQQRRRQPPCDKDRKRDGADNRGQQHTLGRRGQLLHARGRLLRRGGIAAGERLDRIEHAKQRGGIPLLVVARPRSTGPQRRLGPRQKILKGPVERTDKGGPR
jgi:hypothetical protein